MLQVEGLSKAYSGGFRLSDVSFSLESGYILGFIGRNGAGKTTTIKSIMNLVRPDAGKVTIFGKDMYNNETELKQRIGFTVGAADFYPHARISKLTKVYKRFYETWDDAVYRDCLKRFHLDENKKVCELSAGMKVKLGVTYALSHGAELFIFDEPTSGLDPVARDELLDLFRDLVSDGDKSILFSTHVTSDLDKCADYILFIADGKIVAFDTKDDLLDRHALVHGDKKQLETLKDRLVGYKENAFGFSGMILREHLPDGMAAERPDLQDLMVYYNKEGEI